MLEILTSNLTAAAGIIFCFGLVVFIHEFGHFIVAKKSGVKVEQFAFGFGKEIVGFDWGETRYRINWIPLGGYVKMAGEVPEDYEGPQMEGKSDSPENERDRSRDFMALAWYRRIPIVIAGPFMNYVLAVVLFFGVFVVWGIQTQIDEPIVGQTIDGHPAAQAGLQSGDRIIQVDGTNVNTFTDLAKLIHDRPEKETRILVQREDRELDIAITPKLDDVSGRGLIGIVPATKTENVGIVNAFTMAVAQCWMISYQTVVHLAGSLVNLKGPDVTGPIGIGHFITKAVESGWRDFWALIGFISVALGLINLFPIPLVDGSHVVYYVIEGIRGKPLSSAVLGRVNAVGFVLLMTLVVFATTNDIKRIWFSDSPKQEATQK